MNNMMIRETIEELRKLKDDIEEISEVYDIKSSDTIFVLNKAIIACEQLRKYRKKAKRWKRKYQNMFQLNRDLNSANKEYWKAVKGAE